MTTPPSAEVPADLFEFDGPPAPAWRPQGLPVRAARIGGPGLRCDCAGGQLWVTVPIVWGLFMPDIDETHRGWWTPDDASTQLELSMATLNDGGVQGVFTADELHAQRLRTLARSHAQNRLQKGRRGPLSAVLKALGLASATGPELVGPHLEWARDPGYVAAFDLHARTDRAAADLQHLGSDPASRPPGLD